MLESKYEAPASMHLAFEKAELSESEQEEQEQLIEVVNETKDSIQEGLSQDSDEFVFNLPQKVRATIYSFLSHKKVLRDISRISKKERNIVKLSTIARKGKSQSFSLDRLLKKICLCHNSYFPNFFKRLTMAVSLCE